MKSSAQMSAGLEVATEPSCRAARFKELFASVEAQPKKDHLMWRENGVNGGDEHPPSRPGPMTFLLGATIIVAGSVLVNWEAVQRAERNFKKEERAEDGRKAMMEYELQAFATREKTARLKELRLAKEAQTRSVITL
jgi:hypothetical protein